MRGGIIEQIFVGKEPFVFDHDCQQAFVRDTQRKTRIALVLWGKICTFAGD